MADSSSSCVCNYSRNHPVDRSIPRPATRQASRLRRLTGAGVRAAWLTWHRRGTSDSGHWLTGHRRGTSDPGH